MEGIDVEEWLGLDSWSPIFHECPPHRRSLCLGNFFNFACVPSVGHGEPPPSGSGSI